MNQPLDRLKKLTLAAEAALASNDFSGFQALLEARREELAKLPTSAFENADEVLLFDARLQAAATRRMDGLRGRMRQLAHVNRTARAARAAHDRPSNLDLSG